MSTVTGVGRLVRLVLRRDRVRLPLWIVALAGMTVVSAASLPPLYPDQESIDTYAELFGDNPALVAFAGPGYGFDDPNIGVILVNETQLFACIGAALMSIFLVNRHTRAEEDVERAEVIRSSVVGRHAPAAAAVGVVTSANLAVAVLCLIGFVALDYPVAGSVALAASIGAVGLVFTGITAVLAQVASGGRAVLGTSSAALAAAFVLRAIGDIGDSPVRWASPIGWAQAARAFAGEVWWPLLLCAAVTAGLVATAFWLSTHRDLGAGLVPQRPGPATAGRSLGRPSGLALRLQRGAVIGWSVGMLLIGVVYGSIGDDIEQMIEDNPTYADFLAQLEGASLTDSFFATSFTMLGITASGFAISSALRMRTEETAGRVESILATPVSRWRWACSHLAMTIAGTIAVMAAAGLGVGVAYAAVAEDSAQVSRMVGAALVSVPGVLVLAGFAVALFGIAPRVATAAWAGLAAVFVVGFLGELLRLPTWVRQISPFEHLPSVPAEDLRLLPVVVLLVVAVGLGAAGVWGFQRRDLHTD